MSNSPHDIWEQLRKGEQAALSALFLLYHDDMLRYGQQSFADNTTVEDKVQEIFLNLWERRNRLSKPDNILAFLMRALRNALIDENRRRQSQKKMFGQIVRLTTDVAKEIPDLAEKEVQLEQALSQLSEVQREIIFLRFYNKLPYQEIAEVVNMQYQSVRNSAHRAMKVLRKAMISTEQR